MSSLVIKESGLGKQIILSKAFSNRDKILYLAYSIVMVIPMLLSLLFVYDDNHMDPFRALFLLILFSISFIPFYRFLKRATGTEILNVTPETLTIKKGSIFGSKSVSYELNKISNFSFLDKPTLTDHPLKGQTFDYFGFQTEQKVINELYGDNRIKFKYEDVYIMFGLDIYSWDFEQIEMTIFEVSGNSLRYRDIDENKLH